MDELYAAGALSLVGAIPTYAGGGPQIVGNVPTYSAGAMAHAQRQAYAAGAAAAARALPNGQSLGNRVAYGANIGVQNVPERDARLWPMPCSQSGIAASATAQVTARPQVHFRPQRLIVGADGLANFVITQITCGQSNQFGQSGDIDPSSFSPTAVGTAFTFDTVEKGTDLTISVRNTDGTDPHNFLSTFWGSIVK
jgi:hypothetical protein